MKFTWFKSLFSKKIKQKEICIGDNVRFWLRTPKEFGLQGNDNQQYSFQRLDKEDVERGYLDGTIEQIKNNEIIKFYEISVLKTKDNRNFIRRYCLIDDEIKKISLLEVKET